MNWVIKDLKNCKKEYKTLLSSTPLGDDYMREGVILSKKRKKNSYFAVCLYDVPNTAMYHIRSENSCSD